MQKRLIYHFLLLLFIVAALSFTSCVPSSRLKYINDINELKEPPINPRKQKVIMPFDKIFVKIYSIDDKTNQLFNNNSYMTQNANQFFVDEQGAVDFPITGKIIIKGLTTTEAGIKICKTLNDYVPVTSVTTQFIDNNVTIMGEVQTQGKYTFSNDKLTIYEALALGGGINQYGDHKDVILVRQEGDKIMYHRLDLSSSDIIGMEYYYIQDNDVIIVEPRKSSSWYRFNNSNLTIIISSMSSLLSIYTLLFR